MRPHQSSLIIKFGSKSAFSCLASLAALASASLFSAPQANAQALPDAALVEARQEAEKKPRLLTKDEMHLIKVYEVHLDTDPPPRIDIPKKRLNEFLEEFQSDDRIPRGKEKQDAWLKKDGHEQLALIFKVRGREYYKDANIRSRVDSLTEWGRQHRYVLTYFQDHYGDGEVVPGLYLFPRGRETEQIEMTNFYILSQTLIDGKRMIDRNAPEESLLLQWGLPLKDAKFPAPAVPKWRPYFKGPDDPRFKDMVKWIESMHRFNQDSDYGIDYKLPEVKKAEEEPKDE